MSGAAADMGGTPEDIKTYKKYDWRNDNSQPEDITPLKSKRKLLTVEAPPEKPKPKPATTVAPKAATATVVAPIAGDSPGDAAFDAFEKAMGGDTENKEQAKTGTAGSGKNAGKETASAQKSGAASSTVPDVATSTAAIPAEQFPPEPLPPPFPPTSKENRAERGVEGPGKIKISGDVELKVQNASASGDKIGFLSQNGLLYFNNAFQQRTRLNVDGVLKNGLRVDGSFLEMPYQDRVFNINVRGDHGVAKLGDTTTDFRAGPMAQFSKSIRGLDVVYDFGKYSVAAVVSRQKSKTERETFRGQNIRGPYILQSNSILEESETVYINGRPLSNSEYAVDYFLGQISFSRNIDPTDLVEITYESELLVSMKTGAMNGFSLKSDANNKRYDVGAAYMEEGASRASRETVNESMKLYSGAEIAPNTPYPLDRIKLKKQSEIVSVANASGTVTLSRDFDYSMDYPEGAVSFLHSFNASDTVRVSFSYYNQKYLQFIENEELRGSGKDSYVLQKDRIYGGTEYVFLYVNEVYSRKLVRDLDYEVNEANNSIDFLNQNVRPEKLEGRHCEVSYEIVPPNVDSGGSTKRTLTDLTGRVTIGPAVLRAELSETSSDMSLKTIQVLEERVATVGAVTDGIFPLQFNAIRNTEEIYFNDTVSPNSRQIQSTDYLLEYDAAMDRTSVRFKKPIPQGTTILANYKYTSNPSSMTGGSNRTGKAGRLTADVKIPLGNLKAEFMRKSYFYSPPTQYNDLETDRTNLQVSFAPVKGLMVGASYLDQKHGADFISGITYGTNELKGQMEYNFGGGRRAGYSFTRRTRSDNLAPHTNDQTQNESRLEGRYPVGAGDKLAFDFHAETRGFTDATLRTSNYDVMKGGFGVSYNPAENLSLKLSADNNRIKSKAPDWVGAMGDFTTKTLSNVLDVAYRPDKVWTLSAKLDSQAIGDSRESVGGSRLDNMTASVIARPGGRIKMFSTDFIKQNTPNPYYGNSLAEALTARLDYQLARDWLITPSFAYSDSSVAERNRSLSRNAGLRAQYRAQALKGWIASLQFNQNKRSNAQPASLDGSPWYSTKYNQNKIALSTRYIPSGRMEWKNNYIITKDRYTGRLEQRNSITSSVSYIYSPSTTLAFTINRETAPAGTPGRIMYQIDSSTRLDQYFSLGASLKKEKQSGGSSQNYDGTLFNMSLNAEF
ncbi:MAG: hypothetical protein WCX65_13040 [bacterium]